MLVATLKRVNYITVIYAFFYVLCSFFNSLVTKVHTSALKHWHSDKIIVF